MAIILGKLYTDNTPDSTVYGLCLTSLTVQNVKYDISESTSMTFKREQVRPVCFDGIDTKNDLFVTMINLISSYLNNMDIISNPELGLDSKHLLPAPENSSIKLGLKRGTTTTLYSERVG